MPWLPERLPGKDAILWSKRLSSPALAGVAATRELVIVADRDPADRVDIFRCYNADGTERWTIRYAAAGKLDYGNSPRATPQLYGELVFLQGAHGHLLAVELATGKTRWKKHFPRDFGGPTNLSWGFCSSPLIANGQLIANPGNSDASLVALDPATGDLLWKSPGNLPGHGSFIAATLGGTQQLIGYDIESLGGWDIRTGQRLWSITPERPGDFNVPTPIVRNNQVFVATENNGARLYQADDRGIVQPTAIAHHRQLVPDCHSPIIIGSRVFGISDHLFCLDADRKLAQIWRHNDRQFREYASLIGSPERVLITTLQGRLLLFATNATEFEPISDLQLLDDEAGLYSHPAIVGNRLYIRASNSLICMSLDGKR